MELNWNGIEKYLGLERMNHFETKLVDKAVNELTARMALVHDWYVKYRSAACMTDAYSTNWFTPKRYGRFDDCAYE